ncbi:hypothetical protein INT47_008925 [Mucor saturninus]|uniref:Diacylglycerol O-acyltransferase n=1 Tax=Mucor saturninus TaxID=64648 RepID=A0A8H7R275_9FUNG|nr:hypothetical protein INT47_008925 [Mucor saturninus]
MALPLDYAKPLWELHAISGLKGDQCAFFWKAHHVMSDGQGFIRSILSTTSIEATLQRLEQQSLRQDKPKQFVPRYSNKWPYFDMKIFSFVWMVISHIYVCWMTWIHDLWVLLLCMVPLRRNDLMYEGLQSFEKEMSWSEDILMNDIRLVRKIFGGTLNDVMVAVITRCIKDYLEKNGRRRDNYIRLVIPVSLRQPNDWKCHNVVSCNWGFFSMGNEDTKELIKQVRREMKAIKTSFLPKLMYYWISFIWGYMPGITPPRWMYDYVCDIPHGVFTNLPGPTSPISFAGHEVQNYRTFPPQVGKGSIGIALISYNGKVSIGAIADVTNRYPNLTQSICQRFSKEFDFILHEAQMELSKCA